MSEKPELPLGWIVRQSKSYPDRVYYFNVNTGASTWEFPDLLKAYNAEASGPVSPPILSATSLKPGQQSTGVQSPLKPGQYSTSIQSPLKLGQYSTAIQTPLKLPLEPTFSPVQSDSDESGQNISPFYRGKQNYRRSHASTRTNRPTYSQKQVLHPSGLSTSFNERIGYSQPQGVPKNTVVPDSGKGSSKSNTSLLGTPYSVTRPSLVQSSTRVKNTPINSSSDFNRKNSVYSGLENVPRTSTVQSRRSFPLSFNSQSRTSVTQSFSQSRTSVTQSFSQSRTSVTQSFSQSRPSVTQSFIQSRPSVTQSFNRQTRTSVTQSSNCQSYKQHDKTSKDQVLKSPERNPNIIKLGKTVSKTVKQLGQLINKTGAKLNTQVNPNSSFSEKKTLDFSSLNERKSLEKDINDNIKSESKKRPLDREIPSAEREIKKKRLDRSESVVQSKGPESNKDRKTSLSPSKKAVKRKSSEILQRDSKSLIIDDSFDRRKVVRNLQVDAGTSRNVVLKNTPVQIGVSSAVSEDLKVHASLNVSQNALSSSRSFTRQVSEDSNLSLNSPEDQDQSGILRQFIGNKDKLLSIQSWIDNLRDGGGSSSASVDSFPESVSADPDDKRVVISDKSTDCDSGYLSPPLKKMANRTERGWPGDVVKSDITSREITAMEVDDLPVELPESDVLFEEEDMVVDLMLSEVREQMKICPEKVCGTLTATVTELQEFMKEQDYHQKLKGSNVGLAQTPVASSSKKRLYVVIDTNVIINDLTFVEELIHQEITGFGKPVLYIPWIVLQELDSLKQACSKRLPKLTNATHNKANRGIKMLQNMLRMKHPQVKGQTPTESQEAAREFKAECNDDIILMSSLHIRKNINLEVVLLTNDNNLINKALVCGVDAYNRRDVLAGIKKLKEKVPIPQSTDSNVFSASPNELIKDIPRNVPAADKVIPTSSKIHSTPTHHTQIPGPSNITGSSCMARNLLEEEKKYTVEQLAEDIQSKVKVLLKEGLGKVLQTEMELAYNDLWKEIVYRKPPWTLTDILESIRKHWIAVFNLVYQRSVQNHVTYLIQNFIHTKEYSMSELGVCAREASILLDHCVNRNMYGNSLKEIRNSVYYIQTLCDSVVKGDISVQNISSLENYLQTQLSSRPQQTCDISVIDTDLVSMNSVERNIPVKKDEPHSVPSQPTTSSSRNTQSLPATAVRNEVALISSGGNTPQQNLEPLELAAKKLQKIWQHIYTYCDQMRKMLNTTIDEHALSTIEGILNLLVPAAKEIRTAFVVVLSLPLSQLPGHMDKIGNLANQCNSFYTTLQLNDEDPPVDGESFLALFRNGKHRDSLNLFLSQLDEMLCHLYKCLHHLGPDD